MRKILLSLSAVLLLAVSCGTSQEELTQKRIQSLSNAAELGTVEYTVKKIIKTDDAVWYKYGKRKIIFTCAAFIKAGVDMKKFSADKVKINKKENSISITLPQVEILSFNIPPEEINQEFTMVTGFRAEFTPEEKQQLLVLGEKDIREDIPNMGIISDAETNAKQFFSAMFSQLGYDSVDVKFE